jgi:hypothetical protein
MELRLAFQNAEELKFGSNSDVSDSRLMMLLL